MKITCDKSTLSEAVSIVQKAVSSKTTIPALEGILLEAEGNLLHLSGYDLEIGIEAQIEAQVDEEGSIVLNSRIFGDIIRKLPEDAVTLVTDEKMLSQITCGMAQFTILGTMASEFPEIPKVTGERSITLKQDLLKSMIRQTIYAISQNDSKPVLTGSLFDIRDGFLKVVSVDGFRLSIRTEAVEQVEEGFSFIVPGKTLSEIMKILNDTEEEVTLNLTKKHIVFEMENFTLVSRLLEGEFLNYENAIPKDNHIQVTVQTRQLIDSVERASLLINERMKSPLKFNFEYDTVKISCTTPLGKVYDEFHTDPFQESLEIGFNNRYVLDALKACEDDEVVLSLGTPLSPMVVTPKEGNAFLVLVLPVRLKSE